jgi:N-acetylmuramoyl-L-alanine amidase
VAFLAITVAVIAVVIRARGSGPSASGRPLDAAYFAAGSCQAFPPTSGDRHLTVFLDAGHGGIDPGGVGTTSSGHSIEEATETLPVEMEVLRLLQARGFRVVVSRTTAATVRRLTPADVSGGVLSLTGAHDDVAARDVCANDAGAQVLVGVYYDAGTSPTNAGSLTAYDAARPFALSSRRLATLIQHDVVSAMDAQGWSIPDDGVQTDRSLGSLVGHAGDGGVAGRAAAYHHLLLLGPAETGFFTTPSLMPGAVIEPLYLTDPYEGSIADSPLGRRVIAQGIATAVDQYLAPRPGPSGAKTTSKTTAG